MNAKRFMIGCLAGMAVTTCPLAAAAAENYYVALLHCQDEKKSTHAFALYIKTSEEADGKNTLQTRVLVPVATLERERLRTNLQTHLNWVEVLRWAQSINARVTMRGPYPITKEFYDLGLMPPDRQSAAAFGISVKENKGLTRYLDARADADADPRVTEESLYLLIVRGLEPWVQPPGKAPDWLRDRLRLETGEMR